MVSSKEFYITEEDKEWVHNVFKWLIEAYGYPDPEFSPILLTDEFFPSAIAHKKPAVEPLLADLCNLFNIDPSTISYEIEEDIRDSYDTPYQFSGTPFECNVDITTAERGYHFKLFFAKSLLKNPKRLVFNAVFQFIKINLAHGDIEWIRDESQYFNFYMVGIYTGWGVLISQTMIDVGKENEGHWERTWRYVSPMPVPIMAYSMALLSGMIEEKQASWKNYLPPDFRVQYEKAFDYIEKEGNPFYNKQELTVRKFFKEALAYTDAKDYNAAIEIYQKAIFLPVDDKFKATIYGNLGYTILCKGDFKKSIPYFQKSLELDPKAQYAYDNMSFAFIMTGDTDTGMHYHALGQQTGMAVPAYTYRNLAMYHQKKGETKKAKENFKRSFENITIPVDWLEYLYARFLFEQGEQEEAMVYLHIAVEKGEPQAIQWMKEIKNRL